MRILQLSRGVRDGCCIHPPVFAAEELLSECSLLRTVVSLDIWWHLQQEFSLASGWMGLCPECGTIFWMQVQGEPVDFTREIARYLDNEKDRPTWADSKRLTAAALELYTARCRARRRGEQW